MTASSPSYPKSIEAVPYRWFQTSKKESKGKKQGGKVAVLHSPNTSYNDVLVYEPDNEDWWDIVPSNMPIRVAVREPAQNGLDLIAWALPLANQPSELQAVIKQRKPDVQVMIEKKPDPTVAQKKGHVTRAQRLILQGEWLEKHEQQLKVIQSSICNAMFDWYDDDSEDCDSTALNRMVDALHLFMDIGRDLRHSCFCPDSNREGILYYHGYKDSVTELMNLNKENKE